MKISTAVSTAGKTLMNNTVGGNPVTEMNRSLYQLVDRCESNIKNVASLSRLAADYKDRVRDRSDCDPPPVYTRGFYNSVTAPAGSHHQPRDLDIRSSQLAHCRSSIWNNIVHCGSWIQNNVVLCYRFVFQTISESEDKISEYRTWPQNIANSNRVNSIHIL